MTYSYVGQDWIKGYKMATTKRATKYRSLLRKMTHKDKASYESSRVLQVCWKMTHKEKGSYERTRLNQGLITRANYTHVLHSRANYTQILHMTHKYSVMSKANYAPHKRLTLSRDALHICIHGVWGDSFVRETWLNQMCDVSHYHIICVCLTRLVN